MTCKCCLHKITIIVYGQTNKIISFSGQFPKILKRKFFFFFVVVVISVGSNAVAAYTGKNHACLRHKRFTDNDRDQQTYGSSRSRSEKIPEMTRNGHNSPAPPPNVKTINAAVKTQTRRCLRTKQYIFFGLNLIIVVYIHDSLNNYMFEFTGNHCFKSLSGLSRNCHYLFKQNQIEFMQFAFLCHELNY
jgi:hypothetical protein